MPRIRTAKQRSQRIELTYFKRIHALQRWRAILSLFAVAAVLLWVGAMAAGGKRAAYMNGPVAPAHDLIAGRCESCHTPVGAPRILALAFRKHASDQACLACHDAPAHKESEVATPHCASCHVEHKGTPRLAAVSDESCTTCHLDLKTRTGTPMIVTSIGSFDSSHPEFGVQRSHTPDATALRFNHAVHAAGSLQLECSSCHVPETPAGNTASGGASRRHPGTGLMAPITFDNQCASCHALTFDDLVSEPARHGEPQEVQRSVRLLLRDYVEKNQGAAGRADAPPRTADAWVIERAARDEQALWTKTCTLCHVVTDRSPALPEVQRPAIPSRWFARARFDHAPHRALTCSACHAGATTSVATADVLMPTINICQQCHRPGGTARTGCYECHAYHDWSKEKPIEPKLALPAVKRN